VIMTELHPVLQVANRVLLRGDDGKVAMDEKGALLLESAILQHARDPGLAEALRNLFGLVVMLEGELASPEAALALTVVLGKVQPSLQHLAPDIEAVLHRQAEVRAGAVKSNVEKISGSPPKGSVSVRSLHIPELPRPSRAPKKSV
jgi:hypothetical protein